MSKIKSNEDSITNLEDENIDIVEDELFPEQMELPFSDSIDNQDRFSSHRVVKTLYDHLDKADTALQWFKDFNAHVRSTDPFYNVNQNKI